MAYPDLLEKLRETVGAKNVFTGIKKLHTTDQAFDRESAVRLQ